MVSGIPWCALARIGKKEQRRSARRQRRIYESALRRNWFVGGMAKLCHNAVDVGPEDHKGRGGVGYLRHGPKPAGGRARACRRGRDAQGLPSHAVQQGFAYLPKNRRGEALIYGFSVLKNISLPSLHRFLVDLLTRLGNQIAERREVSELATRLNVKGPGIESDIGALSGGNQHKCVLARWVGMRARVCLLNSPAAAVDIGAKAEIFELLRGIAQHGASVLFTSPELGDCAGVCDRVLGFLAAASSLSCMAPTTTNRRSFIQHWAKRCPNRPTPRAFPILSLPAMKSVLEHDAHSARHGCGTSYRMVAPAGTPGNHCAAGRAGRELQHCQSVCIRDAGQFDERAESGLDPPDHFSRPDGLPW